MNREIFDTYVETQLAPTLPQGDVVILDNLPCHKNAKAVRQAQGPSPPDRRPDDRRALESHRRRLRPSTPNRSAGTTSRTLAMRPIKRSAL